MAYLSPQIKAVILDMDGVLWKDTEPLVDLPYTFNGFKKLGLGVILATNNATRTVAEYQVKLAGFGVQIEPEQIINSTMALLHLLRSAFPAGGAVYTVGEPSLVTALAENGFSFAEENVVAVVGGLDRSFTFQKLNRAARLIRSGVPFYGTNPDVTIPTPTGLGPGAGSILAAIQTASGQNPIIAGKPEPAIMQVALDRLNLPSSQALVVGDRLDTDILGGQRVGCPTCLVLSGATSLAELEKSKIRPDLVVENLQSLVDG